MQASVRPSKTRGPQQPKPRSRSAARTESSRSDERREARIEKRDARLERLAAAAAKFSPAIIVRSPSAQAASTSGSRQSDGLGIAVDGFIQFHFDDERFDLGSDVTGGDPRVDVPGFGFVRVEFLRLGFIRHLVADIESAAGQRVGECSTRSTRSTKMATFRPPTNRARSRSREPTLASQIRSSSSRLRHRGRKRRKPGPPGHNGLRLL